MVFGVEPECEVGEQFVHSRTFFGGETGIEGGKRHGAVHRTCVEVGNAQFLCNNLCSGTLASARAPIKGDNKIFRITHEWG